MQEENIQKYTSPPPRSWHIQILDSEGKWSLNFVKKLLKESEKQACGY
jgi:hypothetical protein